MVARRVKSKAGRWGDRNVERQRVVMDALIALIEESEPGAEVPFQAIAERAGISRSVIYRHFADRKDLDAKTREYAVELHLESVMPTVDAADTIREAVSRAVHTYVVLVAEHPRLHDWVEQGAGTDAGDSTVASSTKDAVAQQIYSLVLPIAALFDQSDPGIEVGVYSIVAMVDGAVNRWLRTRPEGWDVPDVSRMLTESLVILLEGHARMRGVSLDVDLPMDELLASARTG
ncbi:TetR/AcrR family transcriptional regulator [Nocardia sp. NPDC058497]|uniref:TetR/AcrR family transcriptional regulator n=1 Tax=Nocardia sp. NPDC058497 TaxID=3346529 RepID=UPI003648B743